MDQSQRIKQLEIQLAAKEEEVIKLKSTSADRIKCYLDNIHELSNEVAPYFSDANNDGKIDKISFMGWLAIIQLLWNKIKENALECHNKTIEVKVPQNWIGFGINSIFSAVGFKL